LLLRLANKGAMTTHQRASRAEIVQKCMGGRGSTADPTGELTTLPQTHYSSIKGPYLRGENGGERMERKGRGGKGRGGGTPSFGKKVTALVCLVYLFASRRSMQTICRCFASHFAAAAASSRDKCDQSTEPLRAFH